ncbi:hypothetical protein BH24CHL6_BH24CHL6_02000 [soil metagenome]
MLVDIIAWIVLGGPAGWIAGMLVPCDQGLVVVETIVLGIVGALSGGFPANALGCGRAREGGDIVNLQSIIVAIIGAVIVVFVVGMFQPPAQDSPRSRGGRHRTSSRLTTVYETPGSPGFRQPGLGRPVRRQPHVV